MDLKILNLFSSETGQPKLSESVVEFRSGDHPLQRYAGKMSTAEACKRFMFVALPPGFKGSNRVIDLEQVAVCLAGQLRIAADGEQARDIAPGDVFRLPQDQTSKHLLTVIGETEVQLLVLQLD